MRRMMLLIRNTLLGCVFLISMFLVLVKMMGVTTMLATGICVLLSFLMVDVVMHNIYQEKKRKYKQHLMVLRIQKYHNR